VTDPAPPISIEGVTHVYRDGAVRALDGVTLRIAPGERVALIGQNGSGKTTLARHLNGLLRPTEGRIVVGGRDASGMSVAQLAREVGLVFQDPDRQIFSGTVRDEVAFGARNVGMRGADRSAAIVESLEQTGLVGSEATNPYDLGVSRRKLLALASVLAMRTPVLVLDEPTTGQDAHGIERVHAIIERLSGAGKTVLAISHDMRFVAESFHRVIVLRAGRVVLDATPHVVFSAASWDALRTTYLEPPLAARVGERLGLGATPTDASLVARLAQ
jgi:energy-coupling factor transport system ATP-binding protein